MISCPLETVRESAEEVIHAYIGLPKHLFQGEECYGGYLTIKNAQTGSIEAIYKIGDIRDGKEETYLALSQEKANRLFKIRQAGGSDTTSWKSRNGENNQYGGAIYFTIPLGALGAEQYILSFSGLSELGDEACMFMVEALLSGSGEAIAVSASSIKHSVYFESHGRPGQEIFNALAEAFEVKM